MKKMIKSLANKAICAAFVVLGAASACAEVITNKLYDAVNTDVEVGYEIKGLADGRETAVVFTKDSYDISWTVPAKLENVQFLVVGGGGAGGSGGGIYGPGGGGGGVVTGILTEVSKDTVLGISVGKGGAGSKVAVVAGEQGENSKVTVSQRDWIVAYGGGGGRQTTFTSGIGSSAGGCPLENKNGSSFISPILVDSKNGDCGSIDDAPNGLIINYQIFGHSGGQGNKDNRNYANRSGAGGGGGAIAEGNKSSGYGSSTTAYGGNGGEGLNSSITGEDKVYGSGGGGAGCSNDYINYGKGGSGAGRGARGSYSDISFTRNKATSGSANQGGGGGGGGHNTETYRESGSGGSGIVVFRYVEPVTAVAQIGEQTFETLEAAFAAAQAGETITLLSDATWTKDYGTSAPTAAAAIDLDGKTLTIVDGLIRFSTITIKNGNIVIDPTGSYTGNGVFYMFGENVLTLDNVKLTAENFIGYSIFCMEGNSDLVLKNNSEITVRNATTGFYGIIVAVSDGQITIENSKVIGDNISRGFQNGNYTIKGSSEITFTGVIKDGIFIGAGDSLKILDNANVNITLNPDKEGRYGINLDASATYEKAETATVVATDNIPKEVVLAGAGTETDPYLIKNIDDLVLFRDSVNAGETKYSAPGVWVALAADIDMAGVNWVGIGSITQDHGFMGNFDGKTFKIKNLTINNPTLNGGYAYAGFFSITEGTETAQNIIKNLTIDNVTINTTGQIVSAAIAYPYYTIVENVNVCGDINITGGDYTAGALAYTRRCVNASNVSVVGNAGSTITGGQAVGGVISDIQMNGGLIANYSNFAAENLTISGTKMVGGISGIIATQTLNGATVKDVTINCADRAGQVAGSFGGTSTISNIVVENVTGADAVIGGGYDGSNPVEAKLGDTFYSTFAEAYAAAKADDTITLLRDVTLTGELLIAKPVTIDGNGHSIVANHTAFILETSSDCEFKNITLNTNNKAKGVKIASGNVTFDNVTIPNSNKSDAITVAGTLTVKNYFKVESSYSIVDARNGAICAEEGSVFDIAIWRGTALPKTSDLKGAVDTNGKPYFCAYGSTTYYRTLTSIAGTIIDLTLLDDVSLSKDITVKGTLNLNGKTLTLAEGKVLKTGGNLTITGGAFANPILLTSASYTVTAPDGLNVITNVEGKKVVYENGVYKLVDIVYAAQIDEQKYETLQAALDAAVAGTGSVTVEILSDIDMTGKTWTPVAVDSDSFVTVNGKGKTITGLNDMLFASTWAGTSGLVINDLTIANSTIVHDENDSAGNIGVGAFVGYPQASATVTLNNCHLENSTVKGGHWTGGLVGIAGGYNGTDGPVFRTLTIDGCSVTGSTITGKGSVGGIIGHGSCSAWTDVIIVDSTVSNNTITSTGSSDNKAGSVMGTIGAAGQPTTVNGVTKTGGMSVSVTTAGNTVKSGGKVITTIYGRQGTETGLLEIAGGTYESYPIEENVEYAAPKDGYIIFENADGKYGVKEGAYVAQINGVKYETLASALAAAQNDAVVELLWAEGNAPIAMNGSVYGKSVTITGTATVDWSKGFLFVGRGGEGDGTVIFDNAKLTSTEASLKNGSYGIHVSAPEKGSTTKCNGTVIIRNNSDIQLSYLANRHNVTVDNSRLYVEYGFWVGGRPSGETPDSQPGVANMELVNNSTVTVKNHNGMGVGHESIGNLMIEAGSTFEYLGDEGLMICNAASLVSAGNFFGKINAQENSNIEISGGVYTQNVNEWCVTGYAALPNLNDQYVVGVKPTATVNSSGATTVPAGEYGVWNGSSYTGTSTEDMPLSFVMQFLADQNEEDMKTSPFADWYGDFVITFTGIENGSFTADGCYLAGHYGDFGWVKVPVDGMTIENGARYPVMLGVGLGQKYDYICSSVEDFKCAMFLTPEIIKANPNLKVKLELAVVDNSQGSDSAASALVNNDKVFSVTEYEYGAEAFAPALPTATVTSIDAPEGTPLTFALNFKADDVTDAQLAYYRDWYADFVLTITGLPEEGVTFNTDGTADGYLAGQYDAWSENWVSVPFEDVTLRNGESIKIMEYAATLMGQSGLKLTYNDVYSFVKNFDCGVYFTPEFLAANPDMKVSLSLRMYKTGDATDEGVAIGEMEEFSAPTVVAKIGSTPYATLEAAIAAAGADDTVTILKNVGTDAAIQVAKKVTIDLNGKTIAATENDKGGDGVFCVVAGGDLTINDSVGTGVINGVGDNDYNIAIWANGGKVTINGGNFTNVGATDKTDPNAHFDLIYAKNGGEVIINGGTFECETPAFTLNSHDTYKGVITVNGGTFVGFDPRNNAAETAGTTFMAAGKYTFAEGGNYIVVTPEDYILNGVASNGATVGDVDSLLAGAVTVTKDGDKYVATATYTFKVTAVDTINPQKSSYELTGGKLRPGKTVAVKYIDLITGEESWDKPESDTVTFKLVIK